MRETEIEQIVDDVYGRALQGFGYRSIDGVTFDIDHAGDPAIFVNARFEDVGEDRLPPGGVHGTALLEIVDRLADLGETRFPYIRHVYPMPAE